MEKILYPFILSTIAGLSTVLGGVFVTTRKNNNKETLGKSLSFSAGIMLSLSFLELLKEGSLGLKDKFPPSFLYLMIFFAFFLGILLSSLVDSLVDENHIKHQMKEKGHSYKIGIIMVITLMVHNFPEGIITFVTGYENLSLGILVSLGIILHNIPEGVAIASPIYYATKNKKKALFYCFISGLAEPLGALLAMVFLQEFLSPFFMNILFLVVAGIMVNVSFQELIKTSEKYVGKKQTCLYTGLGFLLMSILLFVL